MESAPRTWTNRPLSPFPELAAGVRWPDGSVECRFRLQHPAGSLVAAVGEIGLLLVDEPAECTTCSEACG
jgi:hypothetical protein